MLSLSIRAGGLGLSGGRLNLKMMLSLRLAWMAWMVTNAYNLWKVPLAVQFPCPRIPSSIQTFDLQRISLRIPHSKSSPTGSKKHNTQYTHTFDPGRIVFAQVTQVMPQRSDTHQEERQIYRPVSVAPSRCLQLWLGRPPCPTARHGRPAADQNPEHKSS